MLETMANFPPNPEDGELCLPSDVFQEIVSATNYHQSFIDCTAAHVHVEAKISATRSLPDMVPNFEGFDKTGDSVLPLTLLLSREEEKEFAGKSEGTSFFLPRSKDFYKEAKEKIGTGVFLNHQVSLTHHRKRKNVKKGKGNRQKCFNRTETMENQEEPQISDEIGLPNDWIY